MNMFSQNCFQLIRIHMTVRFNLSPPPPSPPPPWAFAGDQFPSEGGCVNGFAGLKLNFQCGMILSSSLYQRLKAVAALSLKDMKGGSPYKLTVKNLSLGLVILIYLAIVIWAWEKTPVLMTTFLPPTDQFDMSSPVISVKAQPVTHTVHKNQKPSIVEVRTDQSPEKIPSQPAREYNLSARIRSEQGLGISPMGVTEKPSSDGIKDENNIKMVTADKKECNYAKGKWVEDGRRPLYSGFGCKQWLSVMWSCRVNKRPDFAYENYRWQPNDCEMPEFEGSKFLRKMQDKTIAFVGDSLGRQQFQSLVCMVTGGRESPEVEDIGSDYGLILPRGAIRPDGWAFRFPSTNTTILYYWSASLCALEPINRTDPHTSFAMHLDRPVQFLQQFLHRFDVLVLNTGHHWNRGKIDGNRWVMYVNGVPNTDRNIAMIGNAKSLTVQSVAKWLDLQLPRHPRLKVFFRTMAPRHFANGDWNTGGSCDSTTPLAGGSEVIMQGGSADPVTEDAVKGTGVKLLDITALSQLRDEGHIANYSPGSKPGMYDCLHWCLPGIPDTWNEIFAAQV